MADIASVKAMQTDLNLKDTKMYEVYVSGGIDIIVLDKKNNKEKAYFSPDTYISYLLFNEGTVLRVEGVIIDLIKSGESFISVNNTNRSAFLGRNMKWCAIAPELIDIGDEHGAP